MDILLRNKYSRIIYQLIQMALSFPLYCLGALIPKSKNIWIFGHTFGYRDNPRYLYEQQLKDPSVRAVWISKDRHPKRVQGERHYYLSLKGLYLQYRAGVACVGTGVADIAGFTTANTFIVQLWHGIPIKKLLLDSPESSPVPARFGAFNRLFYRMLRCHLRKYDLLIAVNEHNRACLSRAFGLEEEKIVITGMPRHDRILQFAHKRCAKRYRILYAPTWRSSIETARRCVETVLAPECLAFFRENAIDVDVSIHPLNAVLASMIHSMDGVRLFQGHDINESLSDYDLLITDFSSIALDFSLLRRPVIFMCGDLTEYAEKRGVYDYFLNIIRSVQVENAKGLMEKIRGAMASDGPVEPVCYEFKADGYAGKRIVQEIKRCV
jgi:CDP-glycerol glycerophosphotransferase